MLSELSVERTGSNSSPPSEVLSWVFPGRNTLSCKCRKITVLNPTDTADVQMVVWDFVGRERNLPGGWGNQNVSRVHFFRSSHHLGAVERVLDLGQSKRVPPHLESAPPRRPDSSVPALLNLLASPGASQASTLLIRTFNFINKGDLPNKSPLKAVESMAFLHSDSWRLAKMDPD